METTKKLVKLYSKYKLYIILLLISIPIISQMNIWSQTMLGAIVDSISDVDLWLPHAGVYTAVIVAYFLAKQVCSIIEQRLSFKVIYNLRAAIAEKVLHIKSEMLHQFSTDDVMQMWNNDIREIQTVSVSSIFNFLILVVSAILALITLGGISSYFPFIALSINILSMLPVKIIGKRNKQRSQNQRKSQVAMNEKFYTIMNAIRLIKTYGKEKMEVGQFELANSIYVDDKLSFFLSSRIYKSVITSLNSIAPTLILLIANFQIRDGTLTIGDIVLATSLLVTISQPFSAGGNFIINLKAIGFKFDHLFRFLEADNERSKGRLLDTNESYALVFNDVSYCVNSFNLLKNIAISIAPGQKVAVVGESGSGKTTLNNLILGLYLPTSGTLLLNGVDIREFDLQAYRKDIHYSQSNVYIYNTTIMQNLTLFGAKEDACVQISQAIGFHNEVISMENGYDTVVDASGSNISGGQKKKIAIIRALTQHSHLYVFDEITRGIDESASALIMNYLLDNIRTTAIFTMHNLDAIERMDKIIVMQTGHVIAEGKHEELYQACDYYQELYDNRKRDDNE